MNSPLRYTLWILSALLAAAAHAEEPGTTATIDESAAARGLAPVGTAFTYQGRLTNAGNPAGGPHDLRFQLYDSLAGGTDLGPILCLDNVSVADGLFTVSLDFGPQFPGAGRFLEISVRANTGLDCDVQTGFDTLAPRQPITASPYAITTRAIFVGDDPQRVGIGTTQPFAGPLTTYPPEWKGLHVAGTDPSGKAVGLFEGFDWSRIHLRNASAAVPVNTRNFVIDNTDGLAYFRWLNDDLGNRSQPLTLSPAGNVGVGVTGAPLARLHIGGIPGTDGLRFPDGTLQITASTIETAEPDLLIVRGRYNEDGVVIGAGFTVLRLSAGLYRVTFTRPWASSATIVVSPSSGQGFGASCVPTPSLSVWNVTTYVTGSAALIDIPFTLIAIGVPQ